MQKLKTLGERYYETMDWTARHILQDEIMMSDKDSPVSEWLEAKVRRIEDAQ